MEQDFTIVNPEGLHARPAAKFVKLSNRFASDIWVRRGDEEVNGKSIMGLMMLAAERGAVIRVSANGNDAEAALSSLGELIDSGFNIEV
ncbi:MAG: HPr family phosphocarrier protein [Verrucomicrobiae bacterium]|nr:HPr family phosphocarrier protein [Verrucomicrobiae bacterium]MCB1087451.1 HPr family phosphocarrier protein [Verrucomicrobiae bacterium]